MTGKEITEALRLGGIENYIFEARILCEELCGIYSEEKDYESSELSCAVEKRITGYPLQYILGKWWFWDCEFFVDENCLIPRTDTEAIVEKAIKLLPKNAYFAVCVFNLLFFHNFKAFAGKMPFIRKYIGYLYG